MPIVATSLPARVRSAIAAYAAAWTQAEGTDLAFPARVRILRPHRLYRYGGERREGSPHVEPASPAGWRCFLRTAEGGVVMLDAFESGGSFAFRLHVGSIPAKWLRLIRSARRSPRLAGAHYAMGTLLAPAVHRSYLWFAPISGRAGYFAETRPRHTGSHWLTEAEWQAGVGSATRTSADLWEAVFRAER